MDPLPTKATKLEAWRLIICPGDGAEYDLLVTEDPKRGGYTVAWNHSVEPYLCRWGTNLETCRHIAGGRNKDRRAWAMRRLAEVLRSAYPFHLHAGEAPA